MELTMINATVEREIEFYDDILLGMQTENGEVYLAVKNVAMNIGLTEDQAKGEVKKIQNLELFKSNWVKFDTLQNEGERTVTRESVFLLEKYVPMWLAQINITPKMKLSNPKAVLKLLTYQKECVDILHQAFMGDENKKKQFYDRFDLEVSIQNIMNDTIEPLHNEIKELKNNAKAERETNVLMQNKMFKLINIVDVLNRKLKVPHQPSAMFEKLKVEFLSFISYSSKNPYYEFYNNLINWFGVKIPDGLDKTILKNPKHWLLQDFGIDKIEEFVNGVMIGRIIKSDAGNWIDLHGIYENNVEFAKIVREFNNKCAYCSSKDIELIEEHMIPQGDEESTNICYNIVPSCSECNKSKDGNRVNNWYKKQDFYNKKSVDKLVEHRKKYYTKSNSINSQITFQ